MGKRLLSILGLLIAIVGIVFGGNLVLVIVGCVILGLGQMIKDKEESTTSSMDMIIKEFFEDVHHERRYRVFHLHSSLLKTYDLIKP